MTAKEVEKGNEWVQRNKSAFNGMHTGGAQLTNCSEKSVSVGNVTESKSRSDETLFSAGNAQNMLR